ncbi:MAG: SPOR domain-containing protein [Paludibacter sp.]|nr:SPOR domain-containing protein [Paludibacter sp.]
MEKLDQHIEKLLAAHDYVVVPEFGGFVVQRISAQITDGRIIPPSSTVAFNPLMHHADGLLAIELAKSESMTYRQAVERISQNVEALKKKLEETDRIELGNVGVLYRDEQQTLCFSPAGNANFLPDNFGNEDILLHVLPDQQTSKTIRFEYKPKVSHTIRYAAAAVLLLGMLMISPRVNDTRINSQASLLSLVGIQNPAKKSIAVTGTEPVSTVSTGSEETHSLAGNEIVPNNDADLYHVIVASLPDKESADRFCNDLLNDNFKEAHVLAPKKNYRVAIMSFADKTEAIQYMENLRKSDERFSQAWVLCK